MYHEEKVQKKFKQVDFTKYIKIIATSSLILSLFATLLAAYSLSLTLRQISAIQKMFDHDAQLSPNHEVDGLPPYSLS